MASATVDSPPTASVSSRSPPSTSAFSPNPSSITFPSAPMLHSILAAATTSSSRGWIAPSRSRNQTYSRLRLAPRKPESSVTAAGCVSPHTTELRASKSACSVADDDGPERAENSLIVGLLKELFAAETNSEELVPIRVEFTDSVLQLPNVVNVVKKRGRGRPWKNENCPVAAAAVATVTETLAELQKDEGENAIKDIVVHANVADWDKEIVNRDGNVVALVALVNLEDPYGPELGRRTEGLATEEELLGFLQG